MRRLAILLVVIVAGVVQAPAQEASRLNPLATGDDTRGWEAVGRLDTGFGSFCTGALIETDLVLTAAHCLFDEDTGRRIPTVDMRFLAGWRNGRAEAYRGVRRAVPHPEFVFGELPSVGRVSVDLALIELDQAIRNPRIRPFETSRTPDKGQPVGVVSYAQDRSEAPALQEVCHVLERYAGAVMLSCSIDFGSSGAPIFDLDGETARIVSVISAKAEADGDPVALASEVTRALPVLRSELLPEFVPLDTQGSDAEIAPVREGIGAKFIRP